MNTAMKPLCTEPMGKPVRGYRFQFGQTLFAYVLDFENFPHTGFGDYLIVGILKVG
jgi:hypothetical protein